MEIGALITTGPATTPAPATSRLAAPADAFAQQLARHEKPTGQQAEISRPSLKKAEPETPDLVSDPALAVLPIPLLDHGPLLAMALSSGGGPAPVSVSAASEAVQDITGLPPALADIRQRLALMEQAGRPASLSTDPMVPTGPEQHPPPAFPPPTDAAPDPVSQAGNPLPGAESLMSSAQHLSPGLADRPLLPAGGTQPGPAPGMLTLAAPVASPAWQHQLGQQLVGLALRSGQSMELHLNPTELGPLQVSLTLTDQDAQVQFLSAHGPVRQAVEQAIPQLREALAEQGISLGETSVGEQGQSFAREQHAHTPSSSGRRTETDTEQPVPAPITASAMPLDGRVDLYA